MPLAKYDHMIQTLAANGSDDALDVGILPRLERTRDDLGDAKTRDPPTHGVIVDAVMIAEEPTWGGVIRKRLDQLLGEARRMSDGRCS